ncbi:MAG: hypothetical protein IT536_04410 [Hyphomicrobiales bacterium]|nr:hypothetical protein [Hyphomicrobiales bacterium]
MTYYSREITAPKTLHDGLCNFVQMIINRIEANEPGEALYLAVDLLNDLQGARHPYASITSPLDDRMRPVLDQVNRQHQAALAETLAKGIADGIEQGRRLERRDIAKRLGLGD